MPSVAALRAFENGHAEVTLSSLRRIARTLRVHVFQLLTFPDEGFVEMHIDSLRKMPLSSFVAMLRSKNRLSEPDASAPAELAAEVLAMQSEGSKLRAVEEALVQQAVLSSRGNLAKAARLLGIERKAVERRWRRISSRG
jgi:DNA-binding NtrC family response regulator